ncbi:MAG TPA: carboxypeptidase regulatory-like domain-containing protein [Ktedonobacteraceae bacterium]|nr:carboxypeptidase regulatory-like domain-containing protein [Ktedonobacteraceae bacterium]
MHASQQGTSSTSDDPPTLSEHLSVQGDPLERITSPLPSNRVQDLAQPQGLTVQPDLVEQAVTKLNEAAHLIEQEEDQSKNDRKPRLYSRASRLSPIVDISADIRRESTPLPKISSTEDKNGNSSSLVDSNSVLPDYWPWLDEDTEDKESDIWANRTDPLISRRIPTSSESARIEEEDIRRAQVDGISTAQFPIPFIKLHSSRLRITFIALAIFAIFALLVDGILLNFAFNHPHHSGPNEYPTLALSTNAASPGSTVHVTLNNFSSSARVVLTHDIQEPIEINGSSSITTNDLGSASFPLVIDADWGPGFHLIVAEDVKLRSTASANLQITGEGITQPAHLLIDTSPLAMGKDFVGTNTIRPFTLAKSGGGSISWSANSDAPWLLVAPSQGIFSQQEVISVAVQRLGLKPGDYHGSLTISSNVSPPQHIEVEMSVQPLPANAGPVLAVTPALLSFTASDGQSTIPSQTLAVSNPGAQALNWSLTPVQGLSCPWLNVSPSTDNVLPGTTRSLLVNVQSQCLLPGAYTATLTFTANGAIDTSQEVSVSMVVQPRCGLVTSTGFLAFTVVAGQTTLANQSFSLNATASCAGASTPWSYSRTASWISITPGSGQLKGTNSSVVTASVNAGGLAPSKNPYYADLSFVFGQSSLTVLAQLTVQPAPPMAPIMSASPLSLNFSNIQGQPDPTGQVVTITNNGRSPLSWHVTATPLPSFVWLGASPAGNTIAPGQSGQVTVHVYTAQLTPGNYVGQITLNGMDAKGKAAPGSPQTIVVNLVIQPPCTLSPPSSSALSFSAVQSASVNPGPQTVLFTGSGSCVWPLSWKTSVAPSASWLNLTSASTTITGAGQSGSLQVTPNISGLVAHTYSTTVTITASDANGVTVQGSTQTFTVTLTVLLPCLLSTPTPATLGFTLAQGQTSSSALPVGLSESGTCARPVAWQGSPSSSWLALTKTSGTDNGAGISFGVKASAVNVTPGTYTGTITIAATDSNGSTVGSAQSVTVTLTVTGSSISGTVLACAVLNCATPQALAGATVTVTNGNATVATMTADPSGNYSFSNIPLGTYTITAKGYDALNTHFTGSIILTLIGNSSGQVINVLPG